MVLKLFTEMEKQLLHINNLMATTQLYNRSG